MVPKARVNISEFPYGRVTKRLRNAAIWINKNNRKINGPNLEFYLPNNIYRKLSPDEFDFLQDQTVIRRMYFWDKLSREEK